MNNIKNRERHQSLSKKLETSELSKKLNDLNEEHVEKCKDFLLLKHHEIKIPENYPSINDKG